MSLNRRGFLFGNPGDSSSEIRRCLTARASTQPRPDRKLNTGVRCRGL